MAIGDGRLVKAKDQRERTTAIAHRAIVSTIIQAVPREYLRCWSVGVVPLSAKRLAMSDSGTLPNKLVNFARERASNRMLLRWPKMLQTCYKFERGRSDSN